MPLTVKQQQIMKAFADCRFDAFSEGVAPGIGEFIDIITEDMVGEVSDTRKGVASVVNSLVEKGFLDSTDHGNGEMFVSLTDEGFIYIEQQIVA